MFELHTNSIFDTFTGEAVVGPLRQAGVTLEQASTVTTTWGEWKATYPESFLIAQDGGIGRTYAENPLGSRDDNGPIFPIGATDSRLSVQHPVIGVITGDGSPVAFDAEAARANLAAGGTVELSGVTLQATGGGITAIDSDGAELPTHQAFWFAWSQFHPETQLWS